MKAKKDSIKAISLIPTLSSKALNEALYHATDITDRCLLPFFLLGDTASDIVNEMELTGTGIYLGVPVRYLSEFALSTMRTLASGNDINYGIKEYHEELNKDGKICRITWIYRGVPIELKVINRKYAVFDHPDFKYYMAEEFKIPNPFDGYWKVRGVIQ